jgi:tryptophan synthase alpha chain
MNSHHHHHPQTKRRLLGVYWTLGDLGMETSQSILASLIDAGVDLLELGLPFSDPLLDGPLIQGSHHQALDRGASFESARALLETTTSLAHSHGAQVSIMTASQLIYNQERRDQLPDVDGILVTDFSSRSVSPFPLPSPRVWFVSQDVVLADDFSGLPNERFSMVYLTRVQGLTGEGQRASEQTEKAIERIRQHTSVPVWLGFGISNREDVAQCYAAGADGAIIGSAFVRQIYEWASNSSDLEPQIQAWVRNIRPE